MSDQVYPDAETLAGQITDRIVERLSASVIPSSFPAMIGDWIRETCKYGSMTLTHVVNMDRGTVLFAQYKFSSDGILNLELRDTNNCPFWSGTFRPADARALRAR